MSNASRYRAAQRAYLREENAKWPLALVPIPRELWPESFRLLTVKPDAVLRSRDFLVQVFPAVHGATRLSICRAALNDDASRWADGVSWDELQRLKNEAGFSDRDAVEVFPAEPDVVNVANMRHLWVLAEPLPFAWRKPTTEAA